eukprot:11183730-Lingulodinium_polyedra.AAC.1
MKRACCNPTFRGVPGLKVQGHQRGLTARRAQMWTDCTVGISDVTAQWVLWTDCTMGSTGRSTYHFTVDPQLDPAVDSETQNNIVPA